MNKEELLKKLAKNVKITRIKQNLTQKQLAEIIGISQNYIACINGKTKYVTWKNSRVM